MISFRRMIVACMAMAATLLVAASANASLVTYADYASWSSSVSGVTTDDIVEPTSPATFQSLGSGDTGDHTIEFGTANFSQLGALNVDASFYVFGTGYSGGLPTAPILSSQVDSAGVVNIQIHFESPVNGFALNYGTQNGSTVSFDLFNGGTAVDSFTKGSTGGNAYNTTNFVGATDTTFDTVLIKATDLALNINNVSEASSFYSAVPEPSTFAMFCIGGAGLAISSFRRKKIAKS